MLWLLALLPLCFCKVTLKDNLGNRVVSPQERYVLTLNDYFSGQNLQFRMEDSHQTTKWHMNVYGPDESMEFLWEYGFGDEPTTLPINPYRMLSFLIWNGWPFLTFYNSSQLNTIMFLANPDEDYSPLEPIDIKDMSGFESPVIDKVINFIVKDSADAFAAVLVANQPTPGI